MNEKTERQKSTVFASYILKIDIETFILFETSTHTLERNTMSFLSNKEKHNTILIQNVQFIFFWIYLK